MISELRGSRCQRLLPADRKSTESLKRRSTSNARHDRWDSIGAYSALSRFDPDQKEGITDQTRLCAMRAGDRSILLLFKKGVTANTDATGAIHIAFGIARSELPAWEAWLSQQGIPIEFRKTWKYGGEALYSATPMVICWRWSHRVYGASTDAVPRG